jgi:hypothetical protein
MVEEKSSHLCEENRKIGLLSLGVRKETAAAAEIIKLSIPL